jgi:hypothetical protein
MQKRYDISMQIELDFIPDSEHSSLTATNIDIFLNVSTIFKLQRVYGCYFGVLENSCNL